MVLPGAEPVQAEVLGHVIDAVEHQLHVRGTDQIQPGHNKASMFKHRTLYCVQCWCFTYSVQACGITTGFNIHNKIDAKYNQVTIMYVQVYIIRFTTVNRLMGVNWFLIHAVWGTDQLCTICKLCTLYVILEIKPVLIGTGTYMPQWVLTVGNTSGS